MAVSNGSGDSLLIKTLERSTLTPISWGIGLPRVVPPGEGITILGHHFPAYTVLSVPAYTIHHDKDIWGLGKLISFESGSLESSSET